MSEDKSPKGVQAYAVNRIGHAAGRKLAAGLWRQRWMKQLASNYPDLMKIVSEGAIALTSMLEVGGDSTLARLANFVAESLSMENLELLEKFEKNPDDPELAAQVEKMGEQAGAKTAGLDVFVAFEHIHKDKSCYPVARLIALTTPPPRTDKQGKVINSPPAPAEVVTTKMSDAIAANKPLCGLCYPALSLRKAEDPQKPKETVPGRNFMEYVMRLHEEDEVAYNGFWFTYLYRMRGPDGPELGRKFQQAFNGKHGYEAFRFVVGLPDRNEHGHEEWHHALDALLGEITPPDTWKKMFSGFFSEEKRQTEEMFRALFAWLERANAERKVKISEKKKSIEKLDEEWKADRKARKSAGTKKKILFFLLAAILTSAYVIQRVTDAPTGSEPSEQKVESSNDR